jgi:hypothetical protein
MANYKNSVYSNNRKSSSQKDYDSYWYHFRQELNQDRLIKEWKQSKTNKQTKG